MESIREIYKIGNGPSSSHTMGPRKAARIFATKNPGAAAYKVTLYGSLAATGVGHLTDKAILEELGADKTSLLWQPETFLPVHPNGMKFEAFDSSGNPVDEWVVYSIGGGDISEDGTRENRPKVYPLSTMEEILQWCNSNHRHIWEFVEEHEGPEIWDYLKEVWRVMQEAIRRGIEAEGVLPGGLNVPRKASQYYIKLISHKESLKRRNLVFAYALAVAEENASGGLIVTAPTCGSSGVLPAVLYMNKENYDFSEMKILRALATSGIIGNLVKTNASISGAVVGCQGEIGTACSMASAAASQLFGGTPQQVEYAASMGLEHFLGLTCDPVAGLVQIPCIERNAFAAARAVDASVYSLLSDGLHLVSFDRVVAAMNQTGHDIPPIYKETALGGLARVFDKPFNNPSL
ncbi:MAG: L-serine dehydratase [Bacteroidales bacterium]|nr:L-serine dehydratase [Bacteroidales bacterium]MDN5330741.1 L-serine dehydratase [Bacteroidales bacterium]NPV36594.1 L-serine ammonia-lyase [Bacteroidales bacterium]